MRTDADGRDWWRRHALVHVLNSGRRAARHATPACARGVPLKDGEERRSGGQPAASGGQRCDQR
jgi:hypothetical protein